MQGSITKQLLIHLHPKFIITVLDIKLSISFYFHADDEIALYSIPSPSCLTQNFCKAIMNWK